MGEMGGGTQTLRVCVQVNANYLLFVFVNFYYVHLIFTPAPDKSLSTAATAAIAAIVCSLVTFITGTMCGALLTVCINPWNKKGHSSEPAPNTQEQQQAAVVYEEVDPRRQKIELKENVAYGPVKPN